MSQVKSTASDAQLFFFPASSGKSARLQSRQE
jgi:hypothetical protein